MNSKFYVSLEAARLLKEKGYNEDYGMSYNEKGEMPLPWDNQDDMIYPAPTKAEAIDWLESKGIVVDVLYRNLGLIGKRHYGSIIHTFNEDGSENIDSLIYYPNGYTDDFLLTRLEAEDAAIIKALELL